MVNPYQDFNNQNNERWNNSPDESIGPSRLEEPPELISVNRDQFPEEILQELSDMRLELLSQYQNPLLLRFKIPLTAEYVDGIVDKLWEASGLEQQDVPYPHVHVTDTRWHYPDIVMGAGIIEVDPEAVAIMSSEDEVAAYIAHSLIHHLCAHEEQYLTAIKRLSDQGRGEMERADILNCSREIRRKNELEADGLSLIMLYNAGYDPSATTSYLRKLNLEVLHEPEWRIEAAQEDLHPAYEERMEHLEMCMQFYGIYEADRRDEGFKEVYDELAHRELPNEKIPARCKYQHYTREGQI